MPSSDTTTPSETRGTAAAPHPRERERLRALHALNVLDTPPSARFDRLTALAATVFDVPTALVSLVAEERQWFLSRCGLEAGESGRDVAFCAHALHEEHLLVIEDARADARFSANPLVTAAPCVRFYAGAVLRDHDGLPLGTLCLISPLPRRFSARERDALVQLAALVANELLPDGAPTRERVRSQLDAQVDPLTRAHAGERFLADVERDLRDGEPTRIGVALVLVAGLEQINEIFGRSVGDEFLVELAARLVDVGERFGAARLGRIGGRRFALSVTTASSSGDERSLADAVERALREPFVTSAGPVSPDLSVGIAFGGALVDRGEVLMEHCRTALPADPLARGLHVALYDERDQLPAHRRLRVAAELHGAIERGDLHLVYQPKIACLDGSIDGLECLLRWQHAELGAIAPPDIINAAVGVNLLVTLDRWVIDTALAQLAEWQRAALPCGTLSANVTGVTLLAAGFVDWLAGRLAHHGIAAGSFELEVLESSLFDDFDAVVQVLDAIRWLDVDISLDDFGTGHSSLAYLRRLPASILKIDRSFVCDLENDPANVALCAGIINLAHELGLSVVAEGVENEHQFVILHAQRCDRVQGYHFSRPVSVDEATRMLARRSPRADGTDARAA